MGSWIITNTPAAQVPDRRRAFESRFSPPGVAKLHTEIHSLGADWHLLFWAWSAPPVPDVAFARNERGDLAVVLCGALTGFGKHGGVPASQGDAAAKVLDLYVKHGGALLPDLNGSFSLGIVDTRRRAVSLYTDRFASRSVWYTEGKASLAAGNFPSAIAAWMAESPALDAAGLWSLFACGRHVGRKGLYNGIHNLQAGEHVALGESATPALSSWFQLRYRPDCGPSVRDWGAAVAKSVQASASRLAAVTARPYLFLSGGLDSRLAAGALGSRTRTVTLTSSANMNARVARKVAERVGASHQTVMRDPYSYLEKFEAAALAGAGNYNIKHAHFMGGVQQVKAADPDAAFLLGDLLENFNKHYYKRLPEGQSFTPELVPDYVPQLYSYGHPDPSRLRRFFRPEVGEQIQPSWRREMVRLCEGVREVSDDGRDCLDALFRWYNSSLCPTYMMLECITPLAAERNLMWDNDLHDLYTRVPADVRGSERTHPWTLWYLDPRLALMPDANAWQPPLAPQAFKKAARRIRPLIGRARRRLMTWRQQRPATRTEGSWQMMQVWFRTDARYRDFIEACLFSETCFPSDIFDGAAIERTWRDFLLSDSADTYEIDILLSFGLLQRRIPASHFHL
jgi:hypothetical protein